MNTSLHSALDWPVVGHDWAVKLLQSVVAEASPSHAYLFTGPDGIGKRTLARIFAQALFCLAPERRPCGECRACLLVRHGNHPDLLVLDLEAQRQLLDEREQATVYKVETVRQLQSDLSRRPVEARWKIILLPEAERMTVAAANAFLKTLEEPPPFAVLVLTTRDKDLLLPTILSRCQALPLRPVPVEQIERFLQAVLEVNPDRAALVARLSNGRVGWAVRAVTEETTGGETPLLEARRAAIETLTTGLRGTRTDRLGVAQMLAKANDPALLVTWASWWRDLLLLKHGSDRALTNVDMQSALAQLAHQLPEPEIRRSLRVIRRTLRLLQETNVNAQLAWEVLLLTFPHL